MPDVGTTTFDGGLNVAILRYVGADEVDPVTNQTTSVAPLIEADLNVGPYPYSFVVLDD